MSYSTIIIEVKRLRFHITPKSPDSWKVLARPKPYLPSCFESLEVSYLTEFSSDYLLTNTSRLAQLDNDKAGLISSLFNVASSQDESFHQSHQLQIQCLHHGSTKPYLCSTFWAPFLSPLLYRWQFAVCTSWLQCKTNSWLFNSRQDLVTALLAESLLTLLILLFRMLHNVFE